MSISHDTPNPSRASSAPARRGFLALLTGAAAAGPAIALAAATEPAPIAGPVIEEAPGLIALGQQLEPLQERLTAAAERKREAMAAWVALRPPLPAEIIGRQGAGIAEWCGMETQEFEEAARVEGREPSYVLRWHRLAAYIIHNEIPPRTKEGRRLRRLAKIAKAYWMQNDKARHAAKVDEALECLNTVMVDASSLAFDMREFRPATFDGALLYARAAALHFAAEQEAGQARHPGMADQAVAALVRIACGRASA